MSNPGRSLDDLPLAAYSTGVVEDELDEETIAEPPHLSQQEAIALAMGVEPPASTEPAPAAPRGGGRATPRVSLPRPSLSRLPRFGGRTRAAAAESPFSVATPVGVASPALAMPVAQYPTSTPTSKPASPAIPRRSPRLDLGGLGATLRNPRRAVRDPRVLFGGMIGIGVVLLGISFLGGGNLGGGAGPEASASLAPGAVPVTTPGAATIQLAGDMEGAFSLTGTTGFGRPADGQLASRWTDASGSVLALSGRVGSGTRTSTPELVLAVTVVVRGATLTFTSEAGECTIGMAEKMFDVTGSFVCPEITSDDGRVTLKITGTYKT
jgi:hypothetical protein